MLTGWYNYKTTWQPGRVIKISWADEELPVHKMPYVKLGLKKLAKVDPFSDLNSIFYDSISDGQNLHALCGMTKDKIAARYSRLENENDIDSDDEWKMSRAVWNAGRVRWRRRQKLTFLHVFALIKSIFLWKFNSWVFCRVSSKYLIYFQHFDSISKILFFIFKSSAKFSHLAIHKI